MLTGTYKVCAESCYKTVEGRELLSAVRIAIKALDGEMRKPPSYLRGERISQITNALELAADRYDLYGEKDRRKDRRKVQP